MDSDGMPGTPLRAVLLDALGTLLELEPPAPRLREALRRRAGVDVGPRAASDAVAREIAFYRRNHDLGRDRAALARLRRRCAEVLRDALPEPARSMPPAVVEAALLEAISFRPYRDAAPALRALRARGLRLVVVSNWDVSLHDVLARTGLAAHVHGAIASAEIGSDKPSKAIFDHALTLAGAPARAAMHVGDSLEADVEGARRAGIAPVLLRRDGTRAPDGVVGVSSLREVVALAR